MLAAEIQARIEAAEQKVRDRAFDEDQPQLVEAVNSLSGSSSSSEISPALLVRLSTVLRDLAKGLRDSNKDSDPLFKHAQEVLNKGLEWYASDVKLINEQGNLYYRTAQYDRALRLFETVIGKNDPPADNADKAYALENAGASLRELWRFQEADAMFVKAIALVGTPSMTLLIERGWLRFY